MKKTIMLGCILVVLLNVMAAGCFSSSDGDSQGNGVNTTEGSDVAGNTQSSNYQDGELELQLGPSELRIGDGEVFRLQLSLRNNGNESVNVVRPRQHLSFSIINADGSDIEYQRPSGVYAPSDGDLVRLDPGESLNVTFTSREWWTDNGEHGLSAKYFVTEDWMIEAPHWSGTIRANNITVIVE